MRHVSRTHRVDLDRFFVRIDLGKANQVEHVNIVQRIAKKSHQTHSCSPSAVLFATACPRDQDNFLPNKFGKIKADTWSVFKKDMMDQKR